MSISEDILVNMLKKRLRETEKAIKHYDKTRAGLQASLARIDTLYNKLIQSRDAILAEFKKRNIKTEE